MKRTKELHAPFQIWCMSMFSFTFIRFHNIKKDDELQQNLQSLLVHVLHVHICKTVSKTTDCDHRDQSHMQFSSQGTNVVKLTFVVVVRNPKTSTATAAATKPHFRMNILGCFAELQRAEIKRALVSGAASWHMSHQCWEQSQRKTQETWKPWWICHDAFVCTYGMFLTMSLFPVVVK